MQAIEITTEIDEKGEIHITVPVDVGAGPARVIVLTENATNSATVPLQDADAFFADLEKFAVTPRSQMDIDTQLKREREDWD